MCKKVISLLRDTRRFYAPPLQAMLAETVSRNVSVEAVMAQPMYKRLVVDLRGFMANCVVRGDPCELHDVRAHARAWLMCCLHGVHRAPPGTTWQQRALRFQSVPSHGTSACGAAASACTQGTLVRARVWNASARATVMPQALRHLPCVRCGHPRMWQDRLAGRVHGPRAHVHRVCSTIRRRRVRCVACVALACAQ